MPKEKCHCNPTNKKWHTGCAHFSGGFCRITDHRMKCVMSVNHYCYRCCSFLNSAQGKALLDLYMKERGSE